MTSWRDSATQRNLDDIDLLVKSAVPRVHRFLDEFGDIFPHAVTVSTAGEVGSVMANPAAMASDSPDSTMIIRQLVSDLQAQLPSLRAAAIMYGVKRGDSSDAIAYATEHVDGLATTIYEPYKKMAAGELVGCLDFGEPIRYGKLSFHKGEYLLWPAKGSAIAES